MESEEEIAWRKADEAYGLAKSRLDRAKEIMSDRQSAMESARDARAEAWMTWQELKANTSANVAPPTWEAT